MRHHGIFTPLFGFGHFGQGSLADLKVVNCHRDLGVEVYLGLSVIFMWVN